MKHESFLVFVYFCVCLKDPAPCGASSLRPHAVFGGHLVMFGDGGGGGAAMGVSSDSSGWVCLDWRTNIVWLLRSGSERIFRQETVEVPFSSGGCGGKTGIKRRTGCF